MPRVIDDASSERVAVVNDLGEYDGGDEDNDGEEDVNPIGEKMVTASIDTSQHHDGVEEDDLTDNDHSSDEDYVSDNDGTTDDQHSSEYEENVTEYADGLEADEVWEDDADATDAKITYRSDDNADSLNHSASHSEAAEHCGTEAKEAGISLTVEHDLEEFKGSAIARNLAAEENSSTGKDEHGSGLEDESAAEDDVMSNNRPVERLLFLQRRKPLDDYNSSYET